MRARTVGWIIVGILAVLALLFLWNVLASTQGY